MTSNGTFGPCHYGGTPNPRSKNYERLFTKNKTNEKTRGTGKVADGNSHLSALNSPGRQSHVWLKHAKK